MVGIMKLKLSLFLVLMITITQSAWTQGCSQCKLLAEQGSGLEEASFGSNINSGILFLMVIPYLILMFLFREQVKNIFSKLFSKKS
ncbi:MAG: hypothetical protein CBB76_03340 [Crocinitomicaceae bacterium TMED16]|nr:MAG: hypothetical protein CBB76_03340 [Crocinitomicaceae bacterium TMED16]